ncbi:hypothetical protein [Cytobacillus firmus]|nr:hypothetical protein [Cytobacillus firmus]URT70609.1 hypothetical protein NAF01_22980 [Cytobacillus firmus]WHY61525.1 hypothetical protein QNH42_23660 [Cytobacillus firmus]
MDRRTEIKLNALKESRIIGGSHYAGDFLNYGHPSYNYEYDPFVICQF